MAGDFRPTASIETLRRRAELLARLRRFLEARGYWEVETPTLSHDCCVDAHLDPFRVPVANGTMFLQTSPEFGMKRLLAAGSGSIYQITRSFRAGEVGPLHNPEFAIVEWYRVGGTMEEFLTEFSVLLTDVCAWPPATSIDYRTAFREFASVDPFGDSDADIRGAAVRHGFSAATADRDELLNFLLAACVEPNLGNDAPQFLVDYPPSQAALADVRPGEPPVAERFELYHRGIELANGFHELTDAAELRRRNVEQNALRVRAGKPPIPEDSRLLAAMEAGLPNAVGVALGFDRLAMLTLGCRSLAEVLAFPIDRA